MSDFNFLKVMTQCVILKEKYPLSILQAPYRERSKKNFANSGGKQQVWGKIDILHLTFIGQVGYLTQKKCGEKRTVGKTAKLR